MASRRAFLLAATSLSFPPELPDLLLPLKKEGIQLPLPELDDEPKVFPPLMFSPLSPKLLPLGAKAVPNPVDLEVPPVAGAWPARAGSSESGRSLCKN